MLKSETIQFLNCFAESDYEAAENECALREVRENIMLSLEQDLNRCKHPIMHEVASIIATCQKMSCPCRGIDVSGRRKKTQIKGVVSLADSCTCRSFS